ncbi:MAG: carbon-nitrogen hydrolase family protein [Thermoplasmata archaeon]|nr:carbon-nitrogen hydrolase family protein [Thermoplasmata archaeon]
MKILMAQTTPIFDVEKNKERLIKIVKNNQADIYIFPEMYLTGYLIRDKILVRAISVDSPFMKEIAEISHGKIIIFGFPERDEFIYNSAGVAYNGEIHVARKIYLPNFGPFEEKLYFKSGDYPFLLSTDHGTIGVQICYDVFFPEVTKIQALNGSDIIVNISASPITSRNLFERVIPARAIENTVFFAYVNWAGLQRTLEFWGGSMLYSPRGNLLYKAPYFQEHIGVVEIDLEEIMIARNLRPTLRDTKKEFFKLSGEKN